MNPVMFAGGRSGKKRLGLILAFWALCVVGGFGGLAIHQNAPGEPATPPSRIAVSPGRDELLVFLHPQCPCSRATVAELDRMLTIARNRLTVRIFAYAPRGREGEWLNTALCRSARAVHGVSLVADPDGRIAARYGVHTSGQTLLYSPSGQLLFSGGITPSRAHEGDSDGKDAILSLIQRGRSAVHTTPVFGCAIGVTSTSS